MSQIEVTIQEAAFFPGQIDMWVTHNGPGSHGYQVISGLTSKDMENMVSALTEAIGWVKAKEEKS